MRGIRRWLTSAALLSGSAAWAQSPALPPVPADEPPIATALPGGTVVSGGRPASQPAAPVTLLPIADTPPTAGAPPVPGPGMPAAGAPIVAPPPPTVKPGGPMFVNIGTITAADNEAELAGVMAHEMSHVYMQHSAKQQDKGSLLQGLAGLGEALAGGCAG